MRGIGTSSPTSQSTYTISAPRKLRKSRTLSVTSKVGSLYTLQQVGSDLVIALGLDGDLICRQNFPLPTVGKSLDRIRLDVHEGKGFGLVRGINPLDYSAEDLTMMYLGVQSYIANLRGRQDEKGNMLGNIHQRSTAHGR